MKPTNLPITAKINKDNHLEIGGCDVVGLAKEFGTPLFVMDEATVRDRCKAYVDAFKDVYPDTLICYASKALCTVGLSKIIASEGLGFEVNSGGEIYTVLKAGANPDKIYFQGNNKPVKEIKEAIKAGVGRIVVDNLDELQNIDMVTQETGLEANILFRINPGIEAHTHEFIQTGKIDSKFGIGLDYVDSAVAMAKTMKKVKLHGFHAHIGSQIFDVEPFVAEAKLLLDLNKKYKTPEINIGGGIGICYTKGEKPPSLKEVAKKIAAVLKGSEARLILEPGRSIVGNAGVTIYSIGGVKDIPKIRKYIFIDGGMSDNPRPILYDAQYEALLGNRANDKKDDKVTVAGRFCESGDILIKDIKVPEAKVGDILVVLATGAYNYSMASNYNKVGRPPMVLVNDGEPALLVKRESYEDLLIDDTAV